MLQTGGLENDGKVVHLSLSGGKVSTTDGPYAGIGVKPVPAPYHLL